MSHQFKCDRCNRFWEALESLVEASLQQPNTELSEALFVALKRAEAVNTSEEGSGAGAPRV